jgi:FixJ family two-component response regulator
VDATDGSGRAQLAELTDREVDVLAALGRGLSNQAIAGELFIAEATVKTHVSRARRGWRKQCATTGGCCARAKRRRAGARDLDDLVVPPQCA